MSAFSSSALRRFESGVAAARRKGAELFILQGLDHTLRTARPMLTLEMGDSPQDPLPTPSRRVVDHMFARGYRGIEFIGGKFIDHIPRERYSYTNILFLPQ